MIKGEYKMDCQEFKVFGPPGCGKTTWTSKQVQKASEKYGSDSVIVASFTRTAATELAGRDLPLEKGQVGTLHAHCYRALGRPPVAETKTEEWNRYAPEFKLSGSGASLDESAVDQVFTTDADETFSKYQVLRAKMIPENMWPQSVMLFGRKWDAWKKENYYVDFTDMIAICERDHKTAPGDPRVGFFDEVQDFTPLELSLIRKWGSQMDFFLLSGDDDQAIYAFKGASPDAFLDPPVPDDHKRILSQSYRVPRQVQKVAQKWVEKLSRREPKEYKPKDEEGEVRRSDVTWKNADRLLDDAQKYLDQGLNVMFLATCSYMLDNIKATLRKNGIPFHNPYRTARGDWNPLATGRGVSSAERLLAYLKPSGEAWGDQASMWWPEDLERWTAVMKQKGVLKKGAKDRIELMGKPGEVTVETLLELFEEDALANAMASDLTWFERNLLAARQKPMEFPLTVVRKFGAQKLLEKPKIVVGTIHSVKGGEADVVYLFPDVSVAGMKEWSHPATRDSVIRQFYVGMTRPKQTLILSNPSTPYYVNLGGLL
jgi:superfamily I DNA/RNA helicase